MHDHPSLGAEASWEAHVAAELAQHLADSVSGLLPAGLDVVANGLELTLVKRNQSGTLRVVESHLIPLSSDPSATPVETLAGHVITDLQDLVISHLGHVWPHDSDGNPLHAWAQRSSAQILLGFRRYGLRERSAGVDLPPFDIPTPPPRTVVAGR